MSKAIWRKISQPGEYGVWVDEDGKGKRMITAPFGPGEYELSYDGVIVEMIKGDLRNIKHQFAGYVPPSRNPAGVEGFSFFEPDDRPVELTPAMRVEQRLGASPEYISADRVLKAPFVGSLADPAVRYFRKKAPLAWMLESGASGPADATRFGKRAQAALVGRRSLTSSDPDVRHLPLFVTYQGGYVELAGLPKHEKKTETSDAKHRLLRKGRETFGAKGVELSGHQGAYRMTIRPVLKQYKGVFGTTTVTAPSIEELDRWLELAIATVSAKRNPVSYTDMRGAIDTIVTKAAKQAMKLLFENRGGVYLYYIPSAGHRWGEIMAIVDGDPVPAGAQAAWAERLSGAKTYEQTRAFIDQIANRLPILPTDDVPAGRAVFPGEYANTIGAMPGFTGEIKRPIEAWLVPNYSDAKAKPEHVKITRLSRAEDDPSYGWDYADLADKRHVSSAGLFPMSDKYLKPTLVMTRDEYGDARNWVAWPSDQPLPTLIDRNTGLAIDPSQPAKPAKASRPAPKSVRLLGPPVRPMEGFTLSPPEPRKCLTPRQIRPALDAIISSHVEREDPKLIDRLAERLADLSHDDATLSASELAEIVEDSTSIRPVPEIDWDAIPQKLEIFRVSTEGGAIRFLCPEYRDGTSWDPADATAAGRIQWILGHLGVDPYRFTGPLIDELEQAQAYSTTDLRDMSQDEITQAFTNVFGREDFIPDYDALIRLLCEAYVLVPGIHEYQTVEEIAAAMRLRDRYRFPERERARSAQGIAEYYSDVLQGWMDATGPFGDLPERYAEGDDMQLYRMARERIGSILHRYIGEFTELAKSEKSKPRRPDTKAVTSGKISDAPVRPRAPAPVRKAPRAPAEPKLPKAAPRDIVPRGGWDPKGLAAVAQILGGVRRGKVDAQKARHWILAYLNAGGWQRDPRANDALKRPGAPDERWNLSKRNVQHQKKRAGDWVNILSEPIVQFAGAMRDQIVRLGEKPPEAKPETLAEHRKHERDEKQAHLRAVAAYADEHGIDVDNMTFETATHVLIASMRALGYKGDNPYVSADGNTSVTIHPAADTASGPLVTFSRRPSPNEPLRNIPGYTRETVMRVSSKLLRDAAPYRAPKPSKPAGLRIDQPAAIYEFRGIEGEGWIARQEADRATLSNPRGFWANLAAFKALQETKAEEGEAAKDLLVWDLIPDAGFIEGGDGRVYTVLPDGSIALNADTATPAKQAAAAKVMIVA